MPAQKRDARRNYIDLVSDESRHNAFAEGQPMPAPRLMDHLLEMIVTMLKGRKDA